MGRVAGRGPFRAIVAELADEQVFVRWLQPGEPDPTDEELEAIAKSYQLGSSTSGRRRGRPPFHRSEEERGNAGLHVNVRVMGYMRIDPLASVLTEDEQAYLAGLNDDGTIG